MSANKKEWISPDVHPNAGTPVIVLLNNVETGKSTTRKATWNRTHWVLRKAGSDETYSIPEHLKIIGWSE